MKHIIKEMKDIIKNQDKSLEDYMTRFQEL